MTVLEHDLFNVKFENGQNYNRRIEALWKIRMLVLQMQFQKIKAHAISVNYKKNEWHRFGCTCIYLYLCISKMIANVQELIHHQFLALEPFLRRPFLLIVAQACPWQGLKLSKLPSKERKFEWGGENSAKI